MAVGKEAFCTSEVSHSNKIYHKNIYFNKKSFTAMFLSAALLLTSVDCMKVQAEELKDQVPPAQTEDAGEPGSVSDNTLPEEEGTTGPDYVKNADGAVIITSFEDLPEDVGHIELGEEETLEEAVGRMPATLKAYADVYVAAEKPGTDESDEPGKEEDKPDAGGEEQPDDEENKPDTGEEGQPGENEGDNTGDDQSGETDGEQPGEGEEDGGTDGGQPGEGEGDNGADGGQPDGEEQPGEGNDGDGVDGGQSGEGDNETDSEQAGDIAVVNAGKSLAAQDEYRWRLLVATDENADRTDNGSSQAGAEGGSGGEGGENRQPDESGGDGDENRQPDGSGDEGGENRQPDGSGGEGGENRQPDESGGDSGEGQQPEGGDNGGNQQPGDGDDGENGGGLRPDDGGGESDGSDQPGTGTPPGTEETPGADDGENVGDRPAADGGTGEETLTPAIKNVEIEGGIPVRWECREAGDEELEEYIFRPTWDETRWVFAGDVRADGFPTITVTCAEKEIVSEISTEAELAAAFAARLTPITLKNDIELTAPLVLPETAIIELDGQGHSLSRGYVEDKDTGRSSEFAGIMIYMDGEKYDRDLYGTLILKNITVNGELTGSVADAEAPAILDSGSLILEENAIVRKNRNCGTQTTEGAVVAAEAYGGGIRVSRQGKLTVTEKAQVTGNHAGELGGGVYLGNGSTLYLYADVALNNTVPDATGKGKDIYAATGSIIYYAASVDLEAMKERGRLFAEDGVKLIPLKKPGEEQPPEAGTKEIYINTWEKSGYRELDILQLRNKLIDLGYTVISNRIYIDPTKLDDWYVYDHYDPEAWKALGEKWEDVYGTNNPLRTKFEYADPRYVPAGELAVEPAYTIEDWMGKSDAYRDDELRLLLAQFKEHIYSRKEDGLPVMTFVGYGKPAFVDFLFYDPGSDGEKVVDFDVDSSLVYTHTLTGTGFLVNTKLADGKLYGYLVYYVYGADENGTRANSVNIYYLDGISSTALHEGAYDLKTDVGMEVLGNPIATYSIPVAEWERQMSIQVKASPDGIEVRQQPKRAWTDISQKTPVLSCKNLSGEAGNAYGPLVAYTSVDHDCAKASVFTYSNLRMYYTDPVQEEEDKEKDMLSPLEKADYTQSGTQKYFVNLFGNDYEHRDYGGDPTKGQYQEYLELMQQEGIALITDRKTPFKDYLGKPGEKDSNLFELDGGGIGISVDELVEMIDGIIKNKDPQSTSMKELLSQVPDDGGLKPAQPGNSAGNIWLKSVASGSQFREVYDASIGDTGYAVQIMDDITYYHGTKDELVVTYEISKPRNTGYTELTTVKPSEEGRAGITLHGMGETDDGVVISPEIFVIEKDKSKWPLGQYTVRQTINNGEVAGYAYFNLTSRPPVIDPPEPEEPDPPTPPEPEEPDPPTPPEPEEPDPPTPPGPEEPDPPTPPGPEEPDPPTPPGPDKPDPPAPDKPAKPGKPSKSPSKPSGSSEPVAEPYVEETIEVSALEPVSTVVPAPKEQEEPEEKNPKEPRTGDMPVATMPVSVGACTAFMMKLRLWLYELETGISEEKKNEILRTLVGWAKGGAMIKVYMAIAATALVLTAYHLLRALDAKRRQALAWFGR